MSEKRLDPRGRFRSKTVSFRASPEEVDLIDAKVRISGYTKREYIMRKLSDSSVIVQGNPRVYKALKSEMKLVYDELVRIEAGNSVDLDLMELIELIAKIMDGMQQDDDWI